ncbi:hypothetical protein MKZ38_003788 [Zalerion maritima]|uniref:Uncharacterized protein n=1 Tax=Zalerion maritima TaxID=339359 RepID=A0AAD5RNI5_9PEZI|nr:hypothetical protein MKZ38_003788 [Zalerion maritima]
MEQSNYSSHERAFPETPRDNPQRLTPQQHNRLQEIGIVVANPSPGPSPCSRISNSSPLPPPSPGVEQEHIYAAPFTTGVSLNVDHDDSTEPSDAGVEAGRARMRNIAFPPSPGQSDASSSTPPPSAGDESTRPPGTEYRLPDVVNGVISPYNSTYWQAPRGEGGGLDCGTFLLIQCQEDDRLWKLHFVTESGGEFAFRLQRHVEDNGRDEWTLRPIRGGRIVYPDDLYMCRLGLPDEVDRERAGRHMWIAYSDWRRSGWRGVNTFL